MIIAIDFDGTIVEHAFPEIGRPVPGAIRWMKRFQELGARLILWTMRSDRGAGGPHDVPEEPYLFEAVAYCEQNGVTFWAVNGNPQQSSWTESPKAYAHLYIDDAAFGCPLTESKRMGGRAMVDWDVVGPEVESLLLRMGVSV